MKMKKVFFFEKGITLRDVWLQHERQHKNLLGLGMVHVAGTKRFPDPQPELSGVYEEHESGLVVVVSARGLVFVGGPDNISFLGRQGMKKVSVGVITSPTQHLLSYSEIIRRKKDPLCLFSLEEEVTTQCNTTRRAV